MVSSVLRKVTMPCLEYDHEPANGVRRDSHALRINRRIPEVSDQLHTNVNRYMRKAPVGGKRNHTVGKKYETVATPMLTARENF